MKIRIISEVDDSVLLESVAKALSETYGEEVEIEGIRGILDQTYLDQKRGQHNAWKLVESYLNLRGDNEYLLLVVGGDLYAPGFNYIFGLAWRGVAVISTYRLRQEFYGLEPDHELLVERAVKEAVHEIGHLHDLTHCIDPRCVMAFSNSIDDTDYKSHTLCKRCRLKIVGRV